MQHQVKKAKEKGEHFVPRDTDKAVLNEAEAEMKETKLPSVIVALLPMIVLLAALNIVKTSVITALFLGIVAGLIFYYPYLPHSLSELWKHGSKASTDATTAIVNTSAAVGFGSVVATTPAFQTAITAVTGIGGNPLIAAGLATTALAGIAGSASGGLGIAVPIIKEYFLPLGVNPEALHRVMVVACGGLDSLPHNGFVITLLTYSGLTHKEAYKDIGITTMLLPLISLAILIALFYFIPGWM
jgi:H+/gluconate symporter-like permease